MVPLTILGALIIPILYKVVSLIDTSSVGDGWPVWFIDIMQSLIMGIVLVLIPSYVAPKKQLLISIIFLTITALVFGILLTFNIPFFEKTGAKLYIALLTILPIVGAAATTYQISQSA